MNSREAAFLAITSGEFISDSLSEWQKKETPSPRDFRLAQEIAMGTVRLKLRLEFYARQLSAKLPTKAKEKALLYMALYQLLEMDRVPPFAILSETVELAKKYCHPTFTKFLNAILRKAVDFSFEKPKDPSIYYSLPPHLANRFSQVTMEALLKPPKVIARLRSPIPELTPFIEEPFAMAEIDPMEWKDSSLLYIQNPTPATLIGEMARFTPAPATVLDLCASPGGKTLACYDLFPEAAYTANDLSEKKLERLRENFAKYGFKANLTLFPGQDYPTGEMFDLVIVDAPCSNTGVLHKKPEARWRNDPELPTLQKALLERAVALTKQGGRIWYLTCSILKEENEDVVAPYKTLYQRTIYPSGNWDGGFGSVIVL